MNRGAEKRAASCDGKRIYTDILHARKVALDHRRQDTERADAFLWEHQCLKAQQKARPRALTAMDVDDLSANMELPADLDDDAGAGGGAGVGAGVGWSA